ncbi:MAG: bifunctional folylpolyglutamate synthase/dihydrofolate synthase, partial [Candidatus Thioglobus sp.]|nr:bifunctional folylpolyglutamate synthase/dihydrofolate synthase [Candidatus Thioglobus sp.]
IDQWLLAPLTVHRAADMSFLVDQFPLKESVRSCQSMSSAIEQALQQRSNQRIIVFGSFHVVADALKVLK